MISSALAIAPLGMKQVRVVPPRATPIPVASPEIQAERIRLAAARRARRAGSQSKGFA